MKISPTLLEARLLARSICERLSPADLDRIESRQEAILGAIVNHVVDLRAMNDPLDRELRLAALDALAGAHWADAETAVVAAVAVEAYRLTSAGVGP